MRKCICLCAAAMALLGLTGNPMHVHAYEPPADIHLTIETKEVDIKDIPENRIIPLNIYTENCPPYVMLTFYLEKDERLRYDTREFAKNAAGMSGIGGISYDYGTGKFPDLIGCSIPAADGKKIEGNGALVCVNMVLPEDAAAGEFYSLDFKRHFTEDGDFEISIALENSFDAMFGNTCFTQLNGGGIQITQDGVPSVRTEKTHTEKKEAEEPQPLPVQTAKPTDKTAETTLFAESTSAALKTISATTAAVPETTVLTETAAAGNFRATAETTISTETTADTTASARETMTETTVSAMKSTAESSRFSAKTDRNPISVTETVLSVTETAVSAPEKREASVSHLVVGLGIVAAEGILTGIVLLQNRK